MQILQRLREAFHFNENAIWKGDMWFYSRGQFWQLMSWCKWKEISSWGTFFLRIENHGFFFLSQALQWLRQDFFLTAASERAYFGKASWTFLLFAADDKGCFPYGQVSHWPEPCIEGWGNGRNRVSRKQAYVSTLNNPWRLSNYVWLLMRWRCWW